MELPRREILRAESIRPALDGLPAFFSRQKKLEYAGLLEKHKEEIANTGKLPKEILSKATKDIWQKTGTSVKVGFVTGIVVGTLLYSTAALIGGPLAAGLASFSRRSVRKMGSQVRWLQEKAVTRKLSPEQMRTRNLEIVEARIRQLRGNR